MGIFLPRMPEVGRPERPAHAIAGAAAAHAVLIALLMFMVPPERIRQAFDPMTVRMIELMPELPKEKPAEVSKPAKKSPLPVIPILTAQKNSEAPAAFSVPPQPPATVAAAPLAASPSPSTAVITGARFDADYLDNPKPVYPRASRRLGEQGKVLLRVFVSAHGLADKVELKLSSGFTRLDQAAQDAVARWRFVPARRGDDAIAAWVQVPINFQLDS